MGSEETGGKVGLQPPNDKVGDKDLGWGWGRECAIITRVGG